MLMESIYVQKYFLITLAKIKFELKADFLYFKNIDAYNE
jgi:hypothetical protein